ncbi:MAG: DNA polymerase Y family protein, partial [Acidimicrobiales bacterium]
MSPPRVLAALCPDWAVIAAGRPPGAEVAVVHTNRVVAASPAARAGGVRPGMRRREAQGACPGLEVLQRDLGAEARSWEPAVAVVEAFAPGVEVLGPGQLAFGSRGPSRYFGGDAALAAKVATAIEAVIGTVTEAGPGGPCPGPRGQDGWCLAGCGLVGVADGL